MLLDVTRVKTILSEQFVGSTIPLFSILVWSLLELTVKIFHLLLKIIFVRLVGYTRNILKQIVNSF